MHATLLAVAALAAAAAGHDVHRHRDLAHRHAERSPAIPARWWHDERAPVAELFKRQGSTADPNSPAFAAAFPPVQGVPNANESAIPARWLAAYNAAKQANLIPDIPVTTQVNGGIPTYPPSVTDPTGPTICSGTLKCRAPGDIWDAPDGIIGISFDDGPVAVAPTLYAFLHEHSIPSTHFMIGRVILGDLDWFDIAYQQNHASIAVHTWSHPMMTTQTDLQQVAEIGWTMQLIHDLTGGRVPKFWRPPLGDCDNRCRAIATHVYNLTTIFWNQDTEDWSLAEGGTTGAWIEGNLTNWLNGPKSPGLIILEHELTNDTISYFMNTTYPLAVKNGWNMKNIPDLLEQNWYQNAKNDLDTDVPSMLVGVSAAAATTPVANATVPSGPGATGTDDGSGPAPTSSGAEGGSTPSGTGGKPNSAARYAPQVATGLLALLAGVVVA